MSNIAGDHSDSTNNTNQDEGMIRLKFSGEFRDRSPYAIDLCTDPKSILRLFVFMAEVKNSMKDDPVITTTIESGFVALTSLFNSISTKVSPSANALAGAIFGPFSPFPKSGSSPIAGGKNKPTEMPPGFPDLNQFENILDKLGNMMDKTQGNPKDKGYHSYSPADMLKRAGIDPKKIFEEDKAGSTEEEDKVNDTKKEDSTN